MASSSSATASTLQKPIHLPSPASPLTSSSSPSSASSRYSASALDDGLTPARWSIFAAIADTVVPAFTPGHANKLLQNPLRPEVFEGAARRIRAFAEGVEGGVGIGDVGEEAEVGVGGVGVGRRTGGAGDDDVVTRYLCESATAQPEFRDSVQRLLRFHMDPLTRANLYKVLDFLNTRAGSFLLTGYATTLDALPVRTREEILQSWAKSRLPPLRDIHTALTSMVKIFWLRTSPTIGRILDYPELPSQRDKPPAFSYPFEFLQFPSLGSNTSASSSSSSPNHPEILSADIVIVGSGCGGAVAAKTLSEAGLRVIVVDKSYFWAPEHLPMSEREAALQMFDNGGLAQTDDGKIGIIAGSTWGGGGTINWSASLQPQGFVRREWAHKFGLPFFVTSQFQADLDAVCERMGVGAAAIEHNLTNSTLLDGARRLGWSAKVVPQNTAGHTHSDGYCTLGCWSGAKQGPTSTFLPDAAKAGAKFIEGFDVTEIMFEDPTSSDEAGETSSKKHKKTVRGVRGIWTSRDSAGGVHGSDRRQREIIIQAPKVLVSAGTLRTPLLLQRSGLRNRHIGRHLHLHPVSLVGAVWPTDVKPWEGSILTSVVTEFENQDGAGYGAKLEATTMLPGWFLTAFPWASGLEWKEFAAKMRRCTGYISLARDRYGGTVTASDPNDFSHTPRIHYVPAPSDRAHILEGVLGLAQIVYVAGAREIFTSIPGASSFVRPTADVEAGVTVAETAAPSVSDAPFAAWLADLRKRGLGSKDAMFASAHQMGTCRMGSSPANSAVDYRGRCWEVDGGGLYVADASVFPSASGVNPMITVMGIARGIARGIVEDFVMEGRLGREGMGRARL